MPEERLPAFATHLNCRIIERQLKTATQGRELLKAKSSALQIQFKKMEARHNKSLELIDGIFQKAFLVLSRAEFYGANIDSFLGQCIKSPIKINTTIESVCGIVLPSFEISRSESWEYCAITRGSAKLRECKDIFEKLLALLVDMASIKSSFAALQQTLALNNRRVNALDHVLIPKMQRTLDFIRGELDEQERETFFKLKKIQSLSK